MLEGAWLVICCVWGERGCFEGVGWKTCSLGSIEKSAGRLADRHVGKRLSREDDWMRIDWGSIRMTGRRYSDGNSTKAFKYLTMGIEN